MTTNPRSTNPTLSHEYWRKRADDVRRLAAAQPDQASRATLSEIAHRYDQLADQLAEHSRGEALAHGRPAHDDDRHAN